MAQYNTFNIKLSISPLNELKSGIKNGSEVALNLSSNLNGNFNHETDFPSKLLLTNTQVSRLFKPFPNNSWASIK